MRTMPVIFIESLLDPRGSPFERGTFKLFLPENYRIAAPKVCFMAKTYHPDKLGRICLDMLEEKCSPALQIRPVLLAIQAWFNAPNPEDALPNDGAEQQDTTEAPAGELEHGLGCLL